MFGPQADEVTGECRKLHNEELQNLYASTSLGRLLPSSSQQNEIGGTCSSGRENEKCVDLEHFSGKIRRGGCRQNGI
jgi:hypothetical protein